MITYDSTCRYFIDLISLFSKILRVISEKREEHKEENPHSSVDLDRNAKNIDFDVENIHFGKSTISMYTR